MGEGGREGNVVDLVLHRLDCVLSVGSWDDTGGIQCGGGVSLKEVSCFWSSTCGSYFQ